ncbi:hypothetical protein DL96DRAFT_1093470 [Flagelloscypha sp. PMI_526]|nr:hypothetical protein DL96DRAFT_1093470 [Flagelloscypha sp. PMI_526]
MITLSEPRLPHELCELIISRVSSAKILRNCCLVSKAFYSASQPLLYANINLVNDFQRRPIWLDWTLMNSPHLARDILSASLPLLSARKPKMEAIARLIPALDHLQDLTLVGDLLGHLIQTGIFTQHRFPHNVIVIDSFRKSWASAFLHLTCLHLKDIRNFQFSIVQSPNLRSLSLENVGCRYHQFPSALLPTANQLQELQIIACEEKILDSSSSLMWFMRHSKCSLAHISIRTFDPFIGLGILTESLLKNIPSLEPEALRALHIPMPPAPNPSRDPTISILLPNYGSLETFGISSPGLQEHSPILRNAFEWLITEMAHMTPSHPLQRVQLIIDGGNPVPLMVRHWSDLADWEAFDAAAFSFFQPNRRLDVILVTKYGKFHECFTTQRETIEKLLPKMNSAGLLTLSTQGVWNDSSI